MRRTKVLLASTALGMSVLVGGCGGGTDAYCEDLRSAQGQFDSFEEGDPAQFEEAVSTFRSLGEEAPEEVAADWETFLAGFDQLEAALTEAGIEFSDLAAISEGEVPEGVDPQALQQLGTEIGSLGGEELQQASDSIEEHASSECDVQLGE